MQGNIDFTGSLSGSIAGGGGGGSDVTITPTLQSGTKIADYTIDSESGSLYAPTPPQGGVLDVQVNNTEVPDYESVVENSIAKLNLYPYLEKSEAYTIIDLVNDEIERVDGKVGDLEQIVPYKQDKLTAGNNITIDSSNVISASGGGSINYSTTEQDTGLTWIDGSHIYQKTIKLENIALANNSFITRAISDYISNISMLLSYEAIVHNKTSNAFYLMPYSLYSTLTGYSINVAIAGDEIDITTGNASGSITTDIYITFRYTKSA